MSYYFNINTQVRQQIIYFDTYISREKIPVLDAGLNLGETVNVCFPSLTGGEFLSVEYSCQKSSSAWILVNNYGDILEKQIGMPCTIESHIYAAPNDTSMQIPDTALDTRYDFIGLGFINQRPAPSIEYYTIDQDGRIAANNVINVYFDNEPNANQTLQLDIIRVV